MNIKQQIWENKISAECCAKLKKKLYTEIVIIDLIQTCAKSFWLIRLYFYFNSTVNSNPSMDRCFILNREV